MNKTLLISSSLIALLSSSAQAQNMLVTYKDGRTPFLKTFDGKQTLHIGDQFPDNDVSVEPWNNLVDYDNAYTDLSATETTTEHTKDGQQVLYVTPSTATKQTRISFSNKTTLHGTYDIYVSFVGAKSINSEDTLPTQFRAYLFVPDEKTKKIPTKATVQFKNPADQSNYFHVPADRDSCLLIGTYTFENTSIEDRIGNAVLQLYSYVTSSNRYKYSKVFCIKEILFVKHQNEPKEAAFGYTLNDGFARYFATKDIKNVLFTGPLHFANEVTNNSFTNTTLRSNINLNPDWCEEITDKGFILSYDNNRVVLSDSVVHTNDISVSTAWVYGTADKPYTYTPFISLGQRTIYGDTIEVSNTTNDLIDAHSLTLTDNNVDIKCKLKHIDCSDPFKRNNSINVKLLIKDTNGDTVYIDPKTVEGLNQDGLSFSLPFAYLQPDKKYVYQFGLTTNQFNLTSDEYPFTAPSTDDFRQRMLPSLIAKDPNVSIFNAALQATGLADSLQVYCDPSYTVGVDSTSWTNDALVIHTAQEYDNVAYMPKRLIKYTAFIEPDYVYNQYGIHSLDDLKRKAAELYDPVYPEDKNITYLTDRRNSLNRFVAYHLLDRMGYYYSLTAVDGESSTLATNNFNRRVLDITDWYETLMPHATLKCSFPSGTEAGLYVNRRSIEDHADNYGIKVRGAKLTPPEDMPKNEAVNGIYHYIDDLIAYDQNTQSTVMNDRMRIDCTTLSPDFMTSGARGHATKFSAENGKYGGGDGTNNSNNKQTCLGFKAGSAKNISFKDNTHLHVRPRTLNFWSYQGDEVTIKGYYDVTVKLPPLPEGDYELRLFTCVGFEQFGIIQFYINGTECSDPVDLRPSGNDPQIGWLSDNDVVGLAREEAEAAGQEFTSEDAEKAIEQFEREFREKGWMKGMDSYGSSSGSPFGASFRTHNNTLRRIIGHFHADGKTDNYLRMQQLLMDGMIRELNFDMIEICPKSIYDNPTVPEDRN